MAGSLRESGPEFVAPPLVVRLVEAVVPASQAEFLLGDLEEEARRLCRQKGLRAARRWYWLQVVRSLAALRIGRRSAPNPVRRNGWGGIVTDLRYTLRSLGRQPGFCFSVVAVLALGIGVNTAIFSIADAVLLQPLPYRDAQQLVTIGAANKEGSWLPFLPAEAAMRFQQEADFFADTAVHGSRSMVWSGLAEPRNLRVIGISHNFLKLLGVAPLRGRPFDPQDARSGAQPVALLSHSLWQSQLGGDEGIVGQTLQLDGRAYLVIGIMPAGFRFPFRGRGDLWVALQGKRWPDGEAADRLEVLARLAADARAEQLEEPCNRLAEGLAQAGLTLPGWDRIRLTPLGSFRANSDVRQALVALWGASGMILLIAVFNLTHLFLVRALGRRRELTIRQVVGASRARLARLLMLESLLLAEAGGVLAVLLALAATGAVLSIVPSELSFFVGTSMEFGGRGFLYAFLLVQLTGLVLGLFSIAGSRGATHRVQELRLGASSPAKSRLRGGLLVAEMALSLALLAGAGLSLRSFLNLIRTEPGYNPANLVCLMVGLSERNYPEAAQRWDFFDRLSKEVAGLPGVEGITLAGGLPPRSGFSFGVALQAEGQPAPTEGQPQLLPTSRVFPDFLKVLQIPLVAGGGFSPNEDPALNRVIIDQALARYLWGEQDPVGRRFRIDDESPWLTVAGMIRDLKLMGQDDRRGRFEILYPHLQGSAAPYESLAIRTSIRPDSLLPAIRQSVHRLDPRQPIQELSMAESALASANDKPRFLLILMSLFAGLALLLTGLGLYGVLAFAVGCRRREMGIRVALGARPAWVRRLVMRDGLRLALPGAVLGMVLALGLSRFLESLLFEVPPTDPPALLAGAAVLLLTASLACYLPARRATQVDPVEVLAAE